MIRPGAVEVADWRREGGIVQEHIALGGSALVGMPGTTEARVARMMMMMVVVMVMRVRADGAGARVGESVAAAGAAARREERRDVWPALVHAHRAHEWHSALEVEKID